MKITKTKFLYRILIDFFMYLILAASLFPIFWMVVTSLKSNYDILLGKVGFSHKSNAISAFYADSPSLYFTSKDGFIGKILDHEKNQKICRYTAISDTKVAASSSYQINQNQILVAEPTKLSLSHLDTLQKENVYQLQRIPWQISRKVKSTVIEKCGDSYYVGKMLIKSSSDEDLQYPGKNIFEGLMVFDQKFHFIKTISDKTIILDNNITVLKTIHQKLYIGSPEGLSIYDPAQNTVIASFSRQKIPGIEQVKAIITDEADTVWIASATHIFSLDKQALSLIPLELPFETSEIQTLFKKDYLFYIGTVNGLYIYDLNRKNLGCFYKDQPKYWNVTSIGLTDDFIYLGLDDGKIKVLENNESLLLSAANGIRKGSWDVRWENYIDMWYNISFGTYLKNSIIICLITVLIALFMATTAGYALSRFRFPGDSFFSTAILAVNMIPALLILIPIYLIYIKFNELTGIQLIGTYTGIIVLYATWFIPMSIWILRSFFVAIPVEIEEAARIDGCNRFQVFWKIALPLAMPGIIATGIYIFLIAWDELLFATILLPQKEMLTIPLGIKLYIGNHQNRFDLMMAAATIATLPVLILFFSVQRWFIKGLTAGAVKG